MWTWRALYRSNVWSSVTSCRTCFEVIFHILRCEAQLNAPVLSLGLSRKIVNFQSIFTNVDTACTSLSLAGGLPDRGILDTFSRSTLKLLPTLLLFGKVLQMHPPQAWWNCHAVRALANSIFSQLCYSCFKNIMTALCNCSLTNCSFLAQGHGVGKWIYLL